MTPKTNVIKICGIGSSWTEAYALSFSQYLEEIGFYVRRYCTEAGTWLIGYCHRPFTQTELEEVLNDLTS